MQPRIRCRLDARILRPEVHFQAGNGVAENKSAGLLWGPARHWQFQSIASDRKMTASPPGTRNAVLADATAKAKQAKLDFATDGHDNFSWPLK